MTAETVGYGFAFFRSHSCAPLDEWLSWLAPDFTDAMVDTRQTNRGGCACGDGYAVSDQYHWHSDGKCHNRVECK